MMHYYNSNLCMEPCYNFRIIQLEHDRSHFIYYELKKSYSLQCANGKTYHTRHKTQPDSYLKLGEALKHQRLQSLAKSKTEGLLTTLVGMNLGLTHLVQGAERASCLVKKSKKYKAGVNWGCNKQPPICSMHMHTSYIKSVVRSMVQLNCTFHNFLVYEPTTWGGGFHYLNF